MCLDVTCDVSRHGVYILKTGTSVGHAVPVTVKTFRLIRWKDQIFGSFLRVLLGLQQGLFLVLTRITINYDPYKNGHILFCLNS